MRTKQNVLVALIAIAGIGLASAQTTNLGTGSSTAYQSNTNIGTNTGNMTTDIGAPFYNRFNVSLGFEAGRNFAAGASIPSLNSTYIGFQAGKEGGGAYNVFVGSSAGFKTTGSNNALIGSGAGALNQGGSENAFIGTNAGGQNTTGFQNTYVGSRSTGMNYNGVANVFVGSESGRCMTGTGTGQFNTFIGATSGNGVLLGSFNVGIGNGAGSGNMGNNNVSIGSGAGQGSIGADNIFMGRNTGNGVTGSNNVFIGVNATTAVTGSGNLVLGSANIAPATAGAIVLGSAGSHRMYISNAGYMGVALGTDVVPANRLELNSFGAVANTTGLRFRNYTAPGTLPASGGRVLTLNANGDVILAADAVGAGGVTIQNGTNTTVTGNGTTTPYAINATFTEVDGSITNEIQTLSGVGNQITLSNGGGSYTVPELNIYSHDGTLNTSVVPTNTAVAGVRRVTMGDSNLWFRTNGAFNNDTQGTGRIYIGTNMFLPNLNTTGPNFSQYRLLVEGGILTEKVKVAVRFNGVNPGVNWADYVFADDYNLMPLSEVEAFVKANKHLPGVASAEELAETGLDLGAMQAKQMEKIEELTLHLIDQNKTIEKQSKEIEELKAQMALLLKSK
jgi:trimeric autotransporter adhesin